MKPIACALAVACLAAVKPGHAQNEGSLNAGGLAPPPAIESETVATGPTYTEEELARADREDSGRGLSFVWLNGEVGYQLLGLQTFHANELVDAEIVESTQNGLVVGVGAGVRLIFLTLGGRFRLGTFESWQLWTLNAEAGFHIPLGPVEPYFTFGGGYAALGSFDGFDDVGLEADALDIDGFNLRGSVGLNYFLGKAFSIGANLSGDLLFLSRARVAGIEASGEDPQAEAAAEVYAADGSSVGGAATLTLVLGLHF